MIVPTIGESTIRTTLDSVLGQTAPPASVTVVNNGGPDPRPHLEGIEDAVEVLEIEVNRGVCPATNLGLRHTSSPHVLFLHPDDALGPTFLRSTSAVLDRHPDVAFATVEGVRTGDAAFAATLAGLPRPRRPSVEVLRGAELLARLVARPGLFVPSMTLMRRSHLAGLPARGDGPWDVRLPSGHDHHLYQQLAARHDAAVVHAPLGAYRVHGQQLSADKPLMWRDRARSMQLLLTEDPVVARDARRRPELVTMRDHALRRWAVALHDAGEVRTARRVAVALAQTRWRPADVLLAGAVHLPGRAGSGLWRGLRRLRADVRSSR